MDATEQSSVSTTFALVVFALLVGSALLIRVHRIDEPLLTFHPTRQYRSAIIARSCFYEAAPHIPEWSRRVALAARLMQPIGEPPVMEWLACAGYRLLGREDVAIPRGLSVLWWVLAAYPLYRVALRMGSAGGALIAVAIYLFLPYGIIASRSFQPDPLMTMCCVWAMLASVRYEERSTRSRLIVAAVAIAIATVVKPMSVFLTLPVTVSLSIARLGWKGTATDRALYTIVVLGILPATIYYGYDIVFGAFVKDQMRMRFVPTLLGSSFFWTGWLAQIRRVFGVPMFVVAMAGVGLAPRGMPRRLVTGLWIGYALFAVAFTYHVPTHDYYHLPFIAAAALAIGGIVARLHVTRVMTPRTFFWSSVSLAVLIAVAGSVVAWPRLSMTSTPDVVRRYEEIGDLAEHDTKVVFLDDQYGYPLMYHGQISGDAWPNIDDLAAESLQGAEHVDAENRFARDYAAFAPRFFVVTDLCSFEAQPDLARFLERHAMLVKQTSSYRVYEFPQRF